MPTPPRFAARDACPGEADPLGACLPLPPTFAPLGPCPEGWSAETVFRRDAQTKEVCVPPPDAGPCPIGEFADVAGFCRPLGMSCAGEPWDADAIRERIGDGFDGDLWFVDAGAGDDGNRGDRAAPLQTLERALRLAGRGDIIALDAGEYVASYQGGGGFAVVGRCARDVVWRSDPASPNITPFGTFGGAALDGIRFESSVFGLFASDGATVTLRDVHVASANEVGIVASDSGTELTLRDVRVSGVVRNGNNGQHLVVDRGAFVDVDGFDAHELTYAAITVTDPGTRLVGRRLNLATIRNNPESLQGRGLLIEGASVELTAVAIRDVSEIGLSAAFGAEVFGEHLYIGDVIGVPQGDRRVWGRGVYVTEDAVLDVSDLVVERATNDGVYQTGGLVVVRGGLVRGTQTGNLASSDFLSAQGVSTNQGEGVYRELVVRDFSGSGFAASAGGILRVEDSAVLGLRRYAHNPNGQTAGGVLLTGSVDASLARVHIEDTEMVGLVADANDTPRALQLVAEDVRVVGVNDVLAHFDGTGVVLSRALSFEGGAEAELARLRVDDAGDYGVMTFGPLQGDAATHVRISDYSFGGVGPEFALGVAATVSRNATLEIVRMSATACGLSCFQAGSGTRFILRDVHVAQTLSDNVGENGQGVILQDTDATFERVRIDDVRAQGVLADQARLQASDLSVRVVRLPPCTQSACSEDEIPQMAYGVALTQESDATFERVEIASAEVAGIVVDESSNATFRGTVVHDSTIGVSTSAPIGDIAFEGNSEDTTTEALAVPSVADILGDLFAFGTL